MRHPITSLWSDELLIPQPQTLALSMPESNMTFRKRKERRDRLASWLAECGRQPGEIARRLLELQSSSGDEVFSDLISVLTHLELAPQEAARHWQAILKHHQSMHARLGCDVDLRVATLDYLLTVDRLLDNPKIVEIFVFDQARESAITDGLTELYNYRYFQLALTQELSRSRRFDKQFSVILLDLDGFKGYNDTCGHLAGDDALRHVARILMDNTRGLDLVARYGGDEFALLLPEVGIDGALILTQRLVRRVQEAHFAGMEQTPAGGLTASAGIASYPQHGRDARSLLIAADQALYRVKTSGKDNVQVAEPLPTDPPEGDVGIEVLDSGRYRSASREDHPR
jgi:diguanylate cyclase (GGDEF)-like protein